MRAALLDELFREKFKVAFFSVAILDVPKCSCIPVCSVNLVPQRSSVFEVNEKHCRPSSALNLLSPAHTETVFYFIFSILFYILIYFNFLS